MTEDCRVLYGNPIRGQRDVAIGTRGARCFGLSKFSPHFDIMASQNCHSSHRCPSLRGKGQLGRGEGSKCRSGSIGEREGEPQTLAPQSDFVFFLLFLSLFFLSFCYKSKNTRNRKAPLIKPKASFFFIIFLSYLYIYIYMKKEKKNHSKIQKIL